MESSVTPRAREDEARARAKRRARAREGDDGVVEVGGGTRGARARDVWGVFGRRRRWGGGRRRRREDAGEDDARGVGDGGARGDETAGVRARRWG